MMLARHRGQDAFVLRCAMAPPWSVRIADEAQVSLLVMTAGRACSAATVGRRWNSAAGDVAMSAARSPTTWPTWPGGRRGW